ncbi:hypothetical protein Micbo1qcDRAFT_216247 [Microdochium bolleyi]|uniref:F-box domain-containing protein n=1 Tax=Microdochium bolleyi TaxID=196109 RepID=A0A136IQP4_9PEZI|nr:hypothetical protein Micbo1qcDRAFT_216247 [Microdochium bolleyi]
MAVSLPLPHSLTSPDMCTHCTGPGCRPDQKALYGWRRVFLTYSCRHLHKLGHALDLYFWIPLGVDHADFVWRLKALRPELDRALSTMSHLDTVDIPQVVSPHHLSALRQDRNNFTIVSNRPGLARHVQVLDWIVYPDNIGSFVRWVANDSDDEQPLHGSHQRKIAQLDAFRQDLNAALVAMPKLSTLVSQVVDAARLSLFPQIQERVGANQSKSHGTGTFDHGLDGLGLGYEFVKHTMAMNCAGRPPHQALAHVTLHGYFSPRIRPTTTFFRPSLFETFSTLTQVRISLTDCILGNATLVLSCLQAARRLQFLAVIGWSASESLGVREWKREQQVAFLKRRLDCHHGTSWPLLEALNLAKVSFPVDTILHFIGLHSTTLRRVRLRLDPPVVTVAHMTAMAQIDGLQLVALRVETPHPEVALGCTEARLYVNSKPGKHWRRKPKLVRMLVSSRQSALVGVRDPKPLWLSNSDGLKVIDAKAYTRWKWGRTRPGGDVHFWGTPGHDGEHTTTWFFTRAGGSDPGRYGDDPYAWWLDWDEGKGDMAFPTPVGHMFRVFVEDEAEDLGHALVDGKGLAIAPRVWRTLNRVHLRSWNSNRTGFRAVIVVYEAGQQHVRPRPMRCHEHGDFGGGDEPQNACRRSFPFIDVCPALVAIASIAIFRQLVNATKPHGEACSSTTTMTQLRRSRRLARAQAGSTTPAATLQAPAAAAVATLDCLTAEIFDMVVCTLDTDDLRALRLANTRHDAVICRYLFRRVRLSMLNSDREAFLTIANHRPDLAQHVRALVWVNFPFCVSSSLASVGSSSHERRWSQYQALVREISSACWIGVSASHGEIVTLLRTFRASLDAALEAMPRLQTFHTKPAEPPHATRFPMIHEAISKHSVPTRHAPEWLITRDFFHEVMDTQMARRQPTTKFSILVLSVQSSHGMAIYGAPEPEHFQHLITVHLKLDQLLMDNISPLLDALLGSAQLQGLAIQVRHTRTDYILSDSELQLGVRFLQCFADRAAGWPRLRDLDISGLPVPVSALAHFIGLHSESLQRLCLGHGSCAITAAHITALSMVSGLQLSELTIAVSEPDLVFDAAELLCFINRTPGRRGKRLRKSIAATLAGHPSHATVGATTPFVRYIRGPTNFVRAQPYIISKRFAPGRVEER